MTLDSDFASALAALLATFAAVFDSGFLFVTGAFSFSGADLPAARDEDDAFDTGVTETFLAAVFVAALLAVFALVTDAAAAVFFTAGFAIDLSKTGLVAAVFAFSAATVVFAVFFIAFAIGFHINLNALLRRVNCALLEPLLTWLGIRPARHFSAIPLPNNNTTG